MRLQDLEEKQKLELIDERRKSADTLWSKIKRIHDENVKLYGGDPDWLVNYPESIPQASLRRGFTNMEAVINSILANPPQPNALPVGDSEDAIKVARGIEKKFVKAYKDRNVKETLRKAFRKLYFCRLLVIKPFWNAAIDDFDAKSIDPRKVRCSPSANTADESEWFFEEVDSSLWSILEKFGGDKEKRKKILENSGNLTEADAFIKNPSCAYEECWYDDYLIIRYKNMILWEGRNPYYDFDGVLTTKEEFYELVDGKKKYSDFKDRIVDTENGKMAEQDMRRGEIDTFKQSEESSDEYSDAATQPKKPEYQAYLFNHFDKPRKPYIIATILKDEDSPIGRTSFLEEAGPLLKLADQRKLDIHKNAKLVNGILKVNKSTGLSQNQAAKIAFEAEGMVYGKDVVGGVMREMGGPLPQFVQLDLQETLAEADNIMAATSAFRGEREGQETKAGRMALIEQSFLRLNELVQVVDYVSYELFNWWYQLMLTRYTSTKYEKFMGKDGEMEVVELSQKNLEKGTQIMVIPGKTLPEDRQFKYERAQADAAANRISLPQYLADAGYEDPKGVAREAFEYQQNPAGVLGIEEQQLPEMPPEMAPQME